MANGLVVADTGISVGGRAVLGANLGRVQVGLISSTSDVALATQASGGTQIGSAVSMVVPSAGVIRLSMEDLEMDETEGSAEGAAGFALKVGSGSLVWATADVHPTASKFYALKVSTSQVSSLQTFGVGGAAFNNSMLFPFVFVFDIAGNSLATGTQDVEVWMGDNVDGFTGEMTLTGTTKTTRFLVEIIDGT